MRDVLPQNGSPMTSTVILSGGLAMVVDFAVIPAVIVDGESAL